MTEDQIDYYCCCEHCSDDCSTVDRHTVGCNEVDVHNNTKTCQRGNERA